MILRVSAISIEISFCQYIVFNQIPTKETTHTHTYTHTHAHVYGQEIYLLLITMGQA